MIRVTLISLGALVLTACGGGGGDGSVTGPPPAGTFTLGGSLAGLASNTTVVLQNNGGNNLSLSANGAFTFPSSLATGVAYSVSVLTQPGGQTCMVSGGTGTVASANITSVVVSCTPQVGKFLYVPNVGSNNVSAYSVNASTGALTAIAGSPFAADQAPSLATADPAGKFLYVINQGSTSAPPRISSYAINATSGMLTPNLFSPFNVTTPPPPNGAVTFNKPVVHPSGQFVYVGSVPGQLYGLKSDGTGGLLDIQGPTTVGNGLGFGDFDAAGTFLYLPHNNFNFTTAGAVSVYQINTAAGTLQSLGQFPTGGLGPTFATLTPSGKFLLVAQNFNGAGSVAVFATNTAGMLTPVAGSPFTTNGIAVVVAAHPT
jgi:6-phosphogluconolactonase (cycloisomerase 2 family)